MPSGVLMGSVSKRCDGYQILSLFLLVLKVTDDNVDSLAQVSGSYRWLCEGLLDRF